MKKRMKYRRALRILSRHGGVIGGGYIEGPRYYKWSTLQRAFDSWCLHTHTKNHRVK